MIPWGLKIRQVCFHPAPGIGHQVPALPANLHHRSCVRGGPLQMGTEDGTPGQAPGARWKHRRAQQRGWAPPEDAPWRQLGSACSPWAAWAVGAALVQHLSHGHVVWAVVAEEGQPCIFVALCSVNLLTRPFQIKDCFCLFCRAEYSLVLRLAFCNCSQRLLWSEYSLTLFTAYRSCKS